MLPKVVFLDPNKTEMMVMIFLLALNSLQLIFLGSLGNADLNLLFQDIYLVYAEVSMY